MWEPGPYDWKKEGEKLAGYLGDIDMIHVYKISKNLFRTIKKCGDCKGCHWTNTEELRKDEILNKSKEENLEDLLENLKEVELLPISYY